MKRMLQTGPRATVSMTTARVVASFLDNIPPALWASIRGHWIDGAAHPLHTYMQATVDAVVASGGGAISLPSGKWPLGPVGLVIQKNVIIQGDGLGSSQITYSGSGNAVQLGDNTAFQNNLYLRDFEVHLEHAAPSAVCIAAYSVLYGALDRVRTTTSNNGAEFSDAANQQKGVLLHGGTWGTLAAGCDTNGTAVHRTWGDVFGQWLVGWPVVLVNGASHTVLSVTDADNLVLAESAGVQTDVLFASYAHGFGAYFDLYGCRIQGHFNIAFQVTGASGWGYNSCIWEGGAIVGDNGYDPFGTGLWIESGGANLLTLIDFENWDVGARIDNANTLLHCRFEGNKTKSLWLTDAGPNNCTVNGDPNFAVVMNPGSNQIIAVLNHTSTGFLPEHVGTTATVLKAGPGGGPLTGTILSVENSTAATLDVTARFQAVPTSVGAYNSQLIGGDSYSAFGAPNLTDDTGGARTAMTCCGIGIQSTNMIGNIAVNGPVRVGGNYGIAWDSDDAINSGLRFHKGGKDGPITGSVSMPGALTIAAGIPAPRNYNGAMTAGDTLLTLTAWGGGGYVPALSYLNVGDRVTLPAGPGGTPWATTIASVIDASHCLLAAAAGVTVSGVNVYVGPVLSFTDPAARDIVINAANATSAVLLQVESQTVFAATAVPGTTGLIARLYGDVWMTGNPGIHWNQTGGSSGLSWHYGAVNEYIRGQLLHEGSGLRLAAGAPGQNDGLVLEAVHPSGVIDFKVAGVSMLQINTAGLAGALTLTGSLAISTPLSINSGGTGLNAFVKGDLLTGISGGTLGKLTVSPTDGHVLTVDIGSPGGMTWLPFPTSAPGNLTGPVTSSGLATAIADGAITAAMIGLSATGGPSQVVRQSSVGGPLTVSMLDFSDLSGSIAQGQLPTTATFDLLTLSSTFPFLIIRNTGATMGGGYDLGWGGHRQWLFGSGVPNNTNTALACTEYTDDVYQGVRLMIFKGGRIAIGSTTDDGSHILQVTGNVKITGSVALTTALAADQGGTGQSAYAKGDILVATAAATLAKLAVGANGDALVADSAQADGVKWGKQAMAFSDLSGAIANSQFPTSPQFAGVLWVNDSSGPEVIVNNTGSAKNAVFSIYNGGNREWLFGTGLPNNTNLNLSFAEFNAGSYVATRMVIARGGNVLIGSTTDDGANKLQVTGRLMVHDSDLYIDANNAGDNGQALYFRKKGNAGGGTAVRQSGYMANMYFQGWDGSQYAIGALIDVMGEELWDGTHRGCTMRFYNAALGQSSAAVRMALSKYGNVLVGTPTDSGNGEKLQVAGDGLVTGNLAVNGTATINTLVLTNALALLYGGTGATTAANARTNLGVDAAGSVSAGTITLGRRTWSSVTLNVVTSVSGPGITSTSGSYTFLIPAGGSEGSIGIGATGRITGWSNPT